MSPIKLPRVKQVWTVNDKLGGWDATQRKFFAGGVRPSRAYQCCQIQRQGAMVLLTAILFLDTNTLV